MAKKILVVDDSALMRRIVCDIINADERFQVIETACNGLEAVDLLSKNSYDAVVLDVNMPKLSGIGVLQELLKRRISAKVIMNSSMTSEGAAVTIEALELGALDFIQKPDNEILISTKENYRNNLLEILATVTTLKIPKPVRMVMEREVSRPIKVSATKNIVTTNKVIAIASSTGGPKALQSVIPKLPKYIDAPILVVQHMPVGFTASLADRLNELSEVSVKEAEQGDVLIPGHVYIARGGTHMKVSYQGGKHIIVFGDEPTREGVKPCANYMYESLRDSNFSQVVCVVMTGMGSDGAKGIENLKSIKNVQVIAQEKSTCVVYGMPRAIVDGGLADRVVAIDEIAQEITMNVGVKNNGC